MNTFQKNISNIGAQIKETANTIGELNSYLDSLHKEVKEKNENLMHSVLQLPKLDLDLLDSITIKNKNPLNTLDCQIDLSFMFQIELPGCRLSMSSLFRVTFENNSYLIEPIAANFEEDNFLWCSQLDGDQIVELNTTNTGDTLTTFLGYGGSKIQKLLTNTCLDITIEDFLSQSLNSSFDYIKKYFDENSILNGHINENLSYPIHLKSELLKGVMTSLSFNVSYIQNEYICNKNIKNKVFDDEDIEELKTIVNNFNTLYNKNKLERELTVKTTTTRKNKI